MLETESFIKNSVSHCSGGWEIKSMVLAMARMSWCMVTWRRASEYGRQRELVYLILLSGTPYFGHWTPQVCFQSQVAIGGAGICSQRVMIYPEFFCLGQGGVLAP